LGSINAFFDRTVFAELCSPDIARNDRGRRIAASPTATQDQHEIVQTPNLRGRTHAASACLHHSLPSRQERGGNLRYESPKPAYSRLRLNQYSENPRSRGHLKPEGCQTHQATTAAGTARLWDRSAFEGPGSASSTTRPEFKLRRKHRPSLIVSGWCCTTACLRIGYM
jgi:hypothetical protein